MHTHEHNMQKTAQNVGQGGTHQHLIGKKHIVFNIIFSSFHMVNVLIILFDKLREEFSLRKMS